MTITVEDYAYYGEEFFAKYRYVQDQIPQATTEEILKIMEMLGKVVSQAKEDYRDFQRSTTGRPLPEFRPQPRRSRR
tara:strand:+ start:5166 stop:5396 length:231 start_codon:yes stop_codon:yes gene_type:complete